MIEWILTDWNVIKVGGALAMFIAFFAVILANTRYSYNEKLYDRWIWVAAIAPTLIISASIITFMETKTEYTYATHWKTIYDSSQETSSTASLSLYRDIIFPIKFKVDTSQEIGSKYSQFQFNEKYTRGYTTGDIVVNNDESEESRYIMLNKEDVIVNGELNQHAKITKIEYLKIPHSYHTFLGMRSNDMKSDFDGKIRITFSGEKQVEKASIFGD